MLQRHFAPKTPRKSLDALMVGTEIQTITSGKINRTKKTDVKMPIRRNLLRHNMLIVFKTLALTIALSTLLTTSKTIKPTTITIDSTSDTVLARPTYSVHV